jgi:hypothetical protein
MDAIDIFCIFRLAVITEFISNKYTNQDETGEPNGKTNQVNDGKMLVFLKAPESSLKIILDQGGRFLLI